MEAKTWQKQPLYFVSFAGAWPGWTLCRNEMCSCWLNGGLGCRLALQSWIKNYFRKFSSWATVLLTTLLCQHVLDWKTSLLTSGNDVCMGLESLLSWDGWGTGRSHPRERAVCGCPVVLPRHGQAAAVQVLNKFYSGVLERTAGTSDLGEDIRVRSSHPGHSELMEVHSHPCLFVVFSPWDPPSFSYIISVASSPVLLCPTHLVQTVFLTIFALHLSHSPLGSSSSAPGAPIGDGAWHPEPWAGPQGGLVCCVGAVSTLHQLDECTNVIKEACSWLFLFICWLRVKLYNCHKLYNLAKARTPFRSLFKITAINNNYTLRQCW